VGAFFLTLAPQVEQFPLWITVFILGAMAFRSLGEARRWPLPSAGFCGLLAICLLGGIYLQFHTILGRDAGTAFMSALLVIKFFELRGSRDVALIIFSSIFVMMSSLLYSQALELFVYCLIMMWILTSLLLRNSRGDLLEDKPRRVLRGSAMVFLQALPLTVFLFFFFPRYHGVLQIGEDASSIGLTDKVQPGSISRLADDDSIAMTVKFDPGVILTQDTLYWRALVLWTYHKGVWTTGTGAYASRNMSQSLPKAASGSVPIHQEITIWPHFHRWLFALDYPVTTAISTAHPVGWSQALNGSVLEIKAARDLIDQKERYTVTSSPLLAEEELSADLRKDARQLPNERDDSIDPQVRALAARLQEGCASEDDYINAVLHYFRHEGFVYSDSPGPEGPNALADFLLRKKVGFCEHYASAFAILMRLGGYPARLVAGYAGAQYNPYTNLYIVKQANAHSWDEVWMENEKHWRRVDPTAIISSSNNRTLSSTNGDGGEDENLSIEVAHHRLTLLSSAHLPAWMRRGLLELQLRRQEMDADWNDLIFSYDPQAQSRLANALGFEGETRGILVLACLAATGVCGLVLASVMRRRRPVTPVEDFYSKFCRNMRHRGLPREDWEGPLAYTERLAGAFSGEGRAIREVGRIVAETRYGAAPRAPTRAELNALLLLITASEAASSSSDPR